MISFDGMEEQEEEDEEMVQEIERASDDDVQELVYGGAQEWHARFEFKGGRHLTNNRGVDDEMAEEEYLPDETESSCEEDLELCEGSRRRGKAHRK